MSKLPPPVFSHDEYGMTVSRTTNKTCQRAVDLKLSQQLSCTERRFDGGSDKCTLLQL